MFPTRVRAMMPTYLRRQTAAPPGGRFNLSTPAGKNNVLLATVAAVTLAGASYYMGFWGMDKVNEASTPAKKD
ncbi:hypothetical protein DFH07DRAFT_965498 [Mycena maculata]|uniref:Uncharacterized protein n=1 Tax=Mycena maculata TaxID=230809 RepID=A0AAD7MZK5_9AGAR|nr:hypothetical protein DFH07DRAFT_965498 [Mycena maculata]